MSSMSLPGQCYTQSRLQSKTAAAVLVAVLILLASLTPEVMGKGIYATVQAPWTETSLMQEGCEWAAKTFGSEGFYACLRAVRAQSTGAREALPAEQYEVLKEHVIDAWSAAGQTAVRHLTPSQAALFGVEMASRVYSPAVEAQYSLAEQAIAGHLPPKGENEAAVRAVCANGEAFVAMETAGGTRIFNNVVLLRAALEEGAVTTPTPSVAAGMSAAEAAARGTGVVAGLDHLFPTHAATESQPRFALVLYGLVGEEATMEMYDAIVEYLGAQQGDEAASSTAFAFRHLPVDVSRLCRAAPPAGKAPTRADSWTSQPLFVQGYGATVDLKNTEYKVVDEKKKSKKPGKATDTAGRDSREDDEAVAGDVGSGVVGGFDMTTLRDRYPTLAVQLNSFWSAMEDELGKEETKVDLDALEVQNIGIAAAQYVREASLAERLAVLSDVVTRFPMYAARLSKLATQSSRIVSVQHMAEHSPLARLIPGALLFVNGVQVPEKDLSLFGVLERLRRDEEFREVVNGLLTTRPPPCKFGDESTSAGCGSESPRPVQVAVDEKGAAAEMLGDVLQKIQSEIMREKLENPFVPPRVAVPLSAMLWLNDLETEPLLEGLPRALSTAFDTTANGQPLMPRRNIVHLTSVLDPASALSWRVLLQYVSLTQRGALARFGIAFFDSTWRETLPAGEGEAAAAPSAGVAEGQARLARPLTAVLWRAAQEGSPRSLANFGQHIAYMAMQGKLTPEMIHEVATETGAVDEELSMEDLTADAEFQGFYNAQQTMLRQIGVSATKLPAVFVDGKRASDADPGNAALGLLMSEMALVRKLIQTNVLTDNMKDLYAALLEHEGAAKAYQPALDEETMESFTYSGQDLLDFLHVQPFLYPTDLSSAAAAAAAKGKAPHVLTSTPLTSVLVVPRDTSLSNAAHAVSTVVAAHQHPPHLPDGEDAPAQTATMLVSGGAARLGLVISSGVDHNAALRSGSVASSIERLVEHDALVEAQTGRHSGLLSQYATWMQKALERDASAEVATSPIDDPASEAVLEAVLPMPSAVKDALTKAAKGPRSPSSKMVKRTAVAFTRAIREQLSRLLVSSVERGTALALPAPLLIINGRVVVMRDPRTITTADLRFLLRHSAVLASSVHQFLSEVEFTQLSTVAADGFSADELDASFFAARTAALESLLSGQLNIRYVSRGASAVGVPEPLLEEEVLPPVKDLGGMAFSIQPSRSSTGGNSTDKAEAPSRNHISIVVDPAARESQLVVSLAEYFLKSPLDVGLSVYMRPALKVDRPIRDVFTFVASTALSFDAESGRVVPPAAVFRALPTQALLTLGIEEPQSWTVFSHEAEEDLDNIVLSRLPKNRQFVTAAYKIQSLMVAGTALELLSENEHVQSASGLPLSLRPLASFTHSHGGAGGAAHSTGTDTLVMRSVGYYQLQGSAGLSFLSIVPGPFAAAYFIAGHNDEMSKYTGEYAMAAADAKAGSAAAARPLNTSAGQQIPLLLSTFSGLNLDLYISAVPPGPAEEIMEIAAREAQVRKHKWPPTGASARRERPAKPTLNIFSVASGHLYERFLRMMMYSVHNASSDKHGVNTTRIKFWVIENFLSPQFKASIPLLAEHFGFEVGFVTYRWPWWLQRQTEKQRKIWAYKILFLDVIFPLEVDRVIFVDADQTDRADLHELYNMDIGEMPVAMTPFCGKNNRNEGTTGFRFWEQGSWVDHLSGKPYHISAIFLIDLHRFRATAAGDIYRGTYANLVRDPNSLANLDQDLPNFVQQQVPIYSLPEEWLWCETWCNAESKARAKTIDLCNNPLTKMPKLDNAKMVIPNWEDTDNMLEDLMDSLSMQPTDS